LERRELPMTASTTARGPVGVGIIGLSASDGWAARAHVPALRAVDGLELRALSASSAESAAAAGRKHGVAITSASAAELARCDEVDLVVVTVKVPHHHELVSAALEAGKMVLCEWPLGNGLAEAEDLAGRARARDIRTFVGLQARSAPPIRYLRDLVADGYVGEVLSSTIVASGGAWGAEVPGESRRYMIDHANGATMLSIPIGHTLDGVASVLGELDDITATVATRRTRVRDAQTAEPLTMTAADQVAVTGRLVSGAVCAIHFRGGRVRGTNFYWEINGSDGDLVVRGPTGHLQFGLVTIQGGHGADTGLSPLDVPASYCHIPALAGQEDTRPYAVAHAYRQLLDDLQSGGGLVPDFDHAVRRHRTLETIAQAGAHRREGHPPGP
jgi:predicted dehydrogenase